MKKNKDQKVWHVNGNVQFYNHAGVQMPLLDNTIYLLCVSDKGFYLERYKDTFEMPIKIYGSDEKFANRVVKTYKAKNNNLGVLLNGIKGSGKTVTAKMISNKLQLPTIMVTHEFNGSDEYLASIEQDFIVFIDEYEKIYKKSDALLGLMDGALSGSNRRLFLLTTNETRISEYLLDRPNRIRYKRSYDQLALDVIKEMVEDLLHNQGWKNEVITFISKLHVLTIDIVGNIIEEVNIHNELPDNFHEFFNITLSQKSYNLFLYNNENGNDKELLAPDLDEKNDYSNYDKEDIDESIWCKNRYLGKAMTLSEDGRFIRVELGESEHTDKFFALKGKPKGTTISVAYEECGYQIHPNFSL